MRKVIATFSIPEETHKLLHTVIGRSKMSNFVTQALNEALAKKVGDLKTAYLEAEKDPARQEVINDWNNIDAEGWE